MKILIVVNSLQQGGSERASIRLAESFQADGHTLILATWNSKRDFYKVGPEIMRLHLGNFFETREFKMFRFRYNFVRIGLLLNLFSYRREIIKQEPDVVICFEALIGSITTISLLGSKIPLIVSERINPDPKIYRSHWIAQKTRPFIFKSRAVCSVQTKGFSEWVKSEWKINPVITPNHLPEEWIKNSNANLNQNKKIVSIGRINYQKGYDNLIKAWKFLGDKTNGWILEIYGRNDDPSYGQFLNSIAPKNVVFHEATSDVIEVLDNSHGFVSSSRFEGFPNIVLESLGRGVPTVAAFSSDIIKTLHDDGALIGYDPEDVNDLSNKILSLMFDSELAGTLRHNSSNAIMKYTWKSVGLSWYTAIDAAVQQQNVSAFHKIRMELVSFLKPVMKDK